jgi:hypothetical protein
VIGGERFARPVPADGDLQQDDFALDHGKLRTRMQAGFNPAFEAAQGSGKGTHTPRWSGDQMSLCI